MDGKELYKAFYKEFGKIDKGFKICLTNEQVKDFLKKYNAPMSLNKFNKTVGCKVRTTDNKYVYDYLKFRLYSMLKPIQIPFPIEYPEGKIKTISYYGTKKSWQKEFELIYEYAQGTGCDTLVDAFGGSGFLSLVASKMGGFKRIILNERFDQMYNYHLVQKDEEERKRFTNYISSFIEEVDKPLFHEMKDYLKKDEKGGNKKEEQGELQEIEEEEQEELQEVEQEEKQEVEHKETKREKKKKRIARRKHIVKADATSAAVLFIVKHYSFSGQGGYVEKRIVPYLYIDALWDTQDLYKDIELKHYHYKKVVEDFMRRRNVLIILDPPYLPETRNHKNSYNVEFSKKQHRYLVKMLTRYNLGAKIVLCGYENPLYNNAFQKGNKTLRKKWHEIKLKKPGRAGKEAKECIWVNFDMSSLVEAHQDLFEIVW